MISQCNTCGAPQQLSVNRDCIYCGGILKGDEIENTYLDDFLAIQYQYKNKRYQKVVDLAEKYIKNDRHNIPCWAYKIVSEFLIIQGNNEPDFKNLVSSIESLIELKIINNDSLIIFENYLKDGIERSLAENYSNRYYQTDIESLVLYANENFSKSFCDWLNAVSKSIANIHSISEIEIIGLQMELLSFCNAARFIVKSKEASVYLLLNKLNYDLVNACTVMNQLEGAGIIGYKMNASDSREVLIKTSEELESYLDEMGYLISTPSNFSKIPNKKNKKECFVATATMGSYNDPLVLDLRYFRDNWLLKRDWGVSFTDWYYNHGPKAARIIKKSILLRRLSYFFFIKPIHILIKLFISRLY
jgi:hypothetical protein